MFTLFLLHSKTWDETVEQKEQQAAWPPVQYLVDQTHAVCRTGRELCLHEQATAKLQEGKKACPVVVGKEQGRETVVTSAQVVTEATVPLAPSAVRIYL